MLLWSPSQEIVQEQITRVLLERLIVNRPHPWGLLITFIELIKNPRCASLCTLLLLVAARVAVQRVSRLC
jgi:CCR4-Not complex component, Not1